MLERELEDFLFQNPAALPVDCITRRNLFTFEGWIDRQFRVPSGRIDLLGLLKKDQERVDPLHRQSLGYHPLIVELKRGVIDSKAVAQVGRYLHDIRETIDEIAYEYGVAPIESEMFAVIIGDSTDYNTLQSASGFGVTLLGYTTAPFSITPGFELPLSTYNSRTENIKRLITHPGLEVWRQEAASDKARFLELYGKGGA